MTQTLAVLASLLVLSSYALGQHRHTAALDRGAEQREVELAATDLARAWLARAVERAFDEADVGENGLRFTTAGLTAPEALGPEPGETDPALYDDIDDFHHPLPSADSVAWDGGFLPFDVTVTVRYVDPADPDAPTSAASLAKEVAVAVRERAAASEGRPPVAGALHAVVSPTAQHFR
jgi:hypothetical protein